MSDIFGEARSVLSLALGDTVDGHQAMRQLAARLGTEGEWIDHPQRAEVVEYLHQQIDRHGLRWPMRIWSSAGSCREAEFWAQSYSTVTLGASHACLALADRQPHRDPFLHGLCLENVNRAGLDEEPGNKFSIPRPSCYPLPPHFTNRRSWAAELLVWPIQRAILGEALDALPKQHDSWRFQGEAILDTMDGLYEMVQQTPPAQLGRVEAPYIAQTLKPLLVKLEALEINQVTVRRRFVRVMRYAGTIEGVWFAVFLRHAPLHWGTSFNTSHWRTLGGEENRAAVNACDMRWTAALNALYAVARKEARR